MSFPIDRFTPLAGDPKRDAADSIGGGCYQIWVSVLTWLEMRPDQLIALEGAEDLDLHTLGGKAATVQIKDTESVTLTLGHRDARAAISNYWKTRNESPQDDILFQFITVSRVGLERDAPFGEGVKGVELWKALRRGDADMDRADAVLRIKDFLLKKRVSDKLAKFLESASEKEILEKIIIPIEWVTDFGDVEKIKKKIRNNIIKISDEFGFDKLSISEIDAAMSVLYIYICDVLKKKRHRILEFQALRDVFFRATGAPISKGTASFHLKLAMDYVESLQRPVSGPQPRKSDESLNQDELSIIAGGMSQKLSVLDDESSITQLNYLDIDAEVIASYGDRKARLRNLLTALERDKKTKLFLVEGVPGSGKSVALRELARLLLTRRKSSFGWVREPRIPIYINLRNWMPTRRWTVQSPPTDKEFSDFVKSTLVDEKMTEPVADLLAQPGKFEDLHRKGAFFFLMDSFDEIPALLDHGEDSWLIKHLSEIIVRFITAHRVRGVIASRPFRRPKVVSCPATTLELRPLTSDRIHKALADWSSTGAEILEFIENRPAFVTSSRNPLVLQLIIKFFLEKRRPPESIRAIYDHFIESEIKTVLANELPDLGDYEKIIAASEIVSSAMFSGDSPSLEIKRDRFNKLNLGMPHKDYLEVMELSRLGRFGSEGTFSFVHRRFSEYFLIRRLTETEAAARFDDVRRDAAWRDALILYAEMAESAAAQALADHAWACVAGAEKADGALRRMSSEARSALRFLTEAFRARPNIVRPYVAPLNELIRNKLVSRGVDLIDRKIAVDAIALLPEVSGVELIRISLHRFPGWISESAVIAARFYPESDLGLSFLLMKSCIDACGFNLFLVNQRSKLFSLCEGYQRLSRWMKAYFLDALKSVLMFLVIIMISIFGESLGFVRCGAIALVGVFALAIIGSTALLGGFLEGLACGREDLEASPKERGRIGKILFGEAEEIEKKTLVKDVNIAITFYSLKECLSWMSVFYIATMMASGISFLELSKESISFTPIENSQKALISLLFLFSLIGFMPCRESFWLRFGVVAENFTLKAFLQILKLSFIVLMGAGTIFAVEVAAVKYAIRMFSGSVAVFGSVVFSVIAVWLGMKWWSGWRRFKQTIGNPTLGRSVIGRAFKELGSKYWRSRFVRWLSANGRRLSFPLGDDWPNGIRPQFVRDKASERLAELDLRWGSPHSE